MKFQLNGKLVREVHLGVDNNQTVLLWLGPIVFWLVGGGERKTVPGLTPGKWEMQNNCGFADMYYGMYKRLTTNAGDTREFTLQAGEIVQLWSSVSGEFIFTKVADL